MKRFFPTQGGPMKNILTSTAFLQTVFGESWGRAGVVFC